MADPPGVIIDGVMLYQELPNLGYDEDGYPLFPSDVDERNSASQWRYCDDTDFLERIP